LIIPSKSSATLQLQTSDTTEHGLPFPPEQINGLSHKDNSTSSLQEIELMVLPNQVAAL
jgi:hypothetical protein